jgi:hypothetical protein
MPHNPDPVWLLFRRRSFSRLSYWCLVLGYDFRDRSLTNRFYFVYFILFWLVWTVAIFALLGHTLAGFFVTLSAASPTDMIILLGAWAFALWGLDQFSQVTGRSPFVFSEPDAFLLCQSPVNRRSVGAAWFLLDWFVTALPFAAASVLFSFTLADYALPAAFTLLDLLAYFSASLRALAVILPLQMGLQAALWGLGAWRLRRDRPPVKLAWLRLLVLLPGLALLAFLFLPRFLNGVLSPLTFFLQAAFDASLIPTAWWVRFGVGLLVLALGSAALLFWSARMHLGRAAEETRLISSIRQNRNNLNFEGAEVLKRQSKMKITRPPSRLPVRSGAWMLVWKDLLQSGRSLRFSQVLRWGWVFLLGLGIFLAPGWLVKVVIGGVWAVSLGTLTTDRLRSELARWWLLRSLPLRTSHLVTALLGPTCLLGILLGWIALALAAPPAPFGWLAAVLLPLLVAGAALGSARDIIDHARARVLLTPAQGEENVPRQDIQGALTVLVAVGVPLALLVWGGALSGGLFFALLSLPVAALVAVLLFRSVCLAYREIR